MASISKRGYWVDPATGKEVRRGTHGAVRRESRFYRIRYRDAAGRPYSVKGYIDLRATRQLAARLEAATARGEEGLVDRFAKHNRRPLQEHIDEYLRDQEMLGRDDENRQITKYRLRRLTEDCGWKRLGDITAESFDCWRRGRAGRPGSSGKTLNDFFGSMRAFLNWCAASTRARIPRNPLAGLERLPHTPTFQRRALQAEELTALYVAAPVERFRVYVFAVTTGLRRQEIADLQWGDVALDAPQPFLQLRDYATKARRADVFAIKAEVAAMLKEIRPQGWSDGDKVFKVVPEVSELVADLQAAGVVLPAGDSIDRIDFHALRTTLGSFIGRAGIAERVGMELMRVTDRKLLHRTYCDPRILGTSQAARDLAIPASRPITPTTPFTEPMILTGTLALPLTVDMVRGKNRTQEVVGDSRPLAATGGSRVMIGGGEMVAAEGVVWSLSAIGGDCRRGGKMDRVGLEPTTKPSIYVQNYRFPSPAGQVSATRSAALARGDDFREIVQLWGQLSPKTRAAVMTLIRSDPAASVLPKSLGPSTTSGQDTQSID